MDPEDIIKKLQLSAHPEGGWYRETFHSDLKNNNRSIASMIYYLIRKSEKSHWHKVTDADEIWLWHSGSALCLSYSENEKIHNKIKLGPDIFSGETFQATIKKGVWQSAKTLGDWSLVSCIVTPSFSFDGFKIAKKDWEPGS